MREQVLLAIHGKVSISESEHMPVHDRQVYLEVVQEVLEEQNRQAKSSMPSMPSTSGARITPRR